MGYPLPIKLPALKTFCDITGIDPKSNQKKPFLYRSCCEEEKNLQVNKKIPDFFYKVNQDVYISKF